MTEQLSREQIEMLRAPMQSEVIRHRPGGGGKQLAYIKGKDAIDAANRIFGFGQWGYTVVNRAYERVESAEGAITAFYTADIELHVAGASFTYPGDGVGIIGKGPVGEAHEKARKEAVTDALKRALRHYGAQFANDLYDEDAYVENGNGDMVKVKDTANKQPVKSQPAKPEPMAIIPQYEAIDRLHQLLGKPAIEQSLTYAKANELIEKMKQEYRASKASAPQSSQNQVQPARPSEVEECQNAFAEVYSVKPADMLKSWATFKQNAEINVSDQDLTNKHLEKLYTRINTRRSADQAVKLAKAAIATA